MREIYDAHAFKYIVTISSTENSMVLSCISLIIRWKWFILSLFSVWEFESFSLAKADLSEAGH